MTDAKGRRASRGWVFFDRDCSVCTSLAQRFRRPLEARGFGLAALQDRRAQALLPSPPQDLLREMRVATSDGKVYGGAQAIVYLARQIWWAYPLFLAAKLPNIPRVLDAGYRWFADHRGCVSGVCSLPSQGSTDSANRHAGGGTRQ
jgi:predicted DCC family thiol-disulfide oxidoreductase YuxK